jgi:hypothetical protein
MQLIFSYLENRIRQRRNNISIDSTDTDVTSLYYTLPPAREETKISQRNILKKRVLVISYRTRNSGLPMAKSRPNFRNGRQKQI